MADAAQGVTIQTRIVIGGGGLGKDLWAPTGLQEVDGQAFLPMHANDRKLSRFLGVSLAGGRNAFLDDLKAKRNKAVDELMLDEINKKDSLSVLTKLPKHARSMVEEQNLPRTISIKCEGFHHKGISYASQDVSVLLEMQTCRVLSVAVDAATLAYVRAAASASEVVATDAKKRLIDPTHELKGIYTSKSRKTVWAKNPIPGASQKTLVKKVLEWDDLSVNNAARELHEEVCKLRDGLAAGGGDTEIFDVPGIEGEGADEPLEEADEAAGLPGESEPFGYQPAADADLAAEAQSGRQPGL